MKAFLMTGLLLLSATSALAVGGSSSKVCVLEGSNSSNEVSFVAMPMINQESPSLDILRLDVTEGGKGKSYDPMKKELTFSVASAETTISENTHESTNDCDPDITDIKSSVGLKIKLAKSGKKIEGTFLCSEYDIGPTNTQGQCPPK